MTMKRLTFLPNDHQFLFDRLEILMLRWISARSKYNRCQGQKFENGYPIIHSGTLHWGKNWILKIQVSFLSKPFLKGKIFMETSLKIVDRKKILLFLAEGWLQSVIVWLSVFGTLMNGCVSLFTLIKEVFPMFL